MLFSGRKIQYQTPMHQNVYRVEIVYFDLLLRVRPRSSYHFDCISIQRLNKTCVPVRVKVRQRRAKTVVNSYSMQACNIRAIYISVGIHQVVYQTEVETVTNSERFV